MNKALFALILTLFAGSTALFAETLPEFLGKEAGKPPAATEKLGGGWTRYEFALAEGPRTYTARETPFRGKLLYLVLDGEYLGFSALRILDGAFKELYRKAIVPQYGQCMIYAESSSIQIEIYYASKSEVSSEADGQAAPEADAETAAEAGLYLTVLSSSDGLAFAEAFTERLLAYEPGPGPHESPPLLAVIVRRMEGSRVVYEVYSGDRPDISQNLPLFLEGKSFDTALFGLKGLKLVRIHEIK